MENTAVSPNFRWDQYSIFNGKALLSDFLVNSLMPTNPYPTYPKEKQIGCCSPFRYSKKQLCGARLWHFFRLPSNSPRFKQRKEKENARSVEKKKKAQIGSHCNIFLPFPSHILNQRAFMYENMLLGFLVVALKTKRNFSGVWNDGKYVPQLRLSE